MDETKTIDISSRVYNIFIALVTIVAIFMAGQLLMQFKSLPENAPHEVTVSGEGKSYAKPDVAIINFGAHTEAPKSQDAVSNNNDIMNAVVNAIKESGVEDKDIRTTLYQLSPVYDYQYGVTPMAPVGEGGAIAYPYPGPSRQVIRGYSLDQQIQVKIRNFDNINEILDKAAEHGANTIGELQFTVDDMEKVRAEAREEAINKAKEKARLLFNQTGLRSVKLVNISEGYSPYPLPYGRGGDLVAEVKTIEAPQIQTGQLEINTVVTLTYRVK